MNGPICRPARRALPASWGDGTKCGACRAIGVRNVRRAARSNAAAFAGYRGRARAVRLIAGRRRAGAGRSVRGSFGGPLLPQLRPIFQAFSDLALEAAFGRIVKCLPLQRVGKIVLARESFFGIVVVGIAPAVTLLLHQSGRCIEDMFWRQQGTRFLRRAHSSTEGGIT